MAYCDHCNTQLPEKARYYFSCGKEVYQVKPRAIGSITHRDVVPYREERQDRNEECISITPCLVTADPEAAALILYGSASMQGESISLETSFVLHTNIFYANVMPRQVKGRTYYVALFPRIYFFTYNNKKVDITHVSCVLSGLPRKLSGVWCEKGESVTLYPGLVTEVDWSRIEGDLKIMCIIESSWLLTSRSGITSGL